MISLYLLTGPGADVSVMGFFFPRPPRDLLRAISVDNERIIGIFDGKVVERVGR